MRRLSVCHASNAGCSFCVLVSEEEGLVLTNELLLILMMSVESNAEMRKV